MTQDNAPSCALHEGKPVVEPRRLVHLAEASFSIGWAKMSVGIIRYGVHESVAVIDSVVAGKTVEEILGYGGPIPIVASLDEALHHKPQALVIGITPVGGRLPDEWRPLLLKAIANGIDIYAGLHDFLGEDEELAGEARARGVRIWDIRKPRKDLHVGGGACRWAKSYIALMVGTDCALGKMTVALEIDRAARKRGVRSEFVATGQTGIAIAGWGSPIDAIPGDFMAGSVERDILSVDGADMILVEGQGSLMHPGYSSVTLGLLHGACPDGLVLCHEAGRNCVSKIESIPIPKLSEVAKGYLELAKPIKPTEVVACSLNTRSLSDADAKDAIKAAEDDLQVPATDPVRFDPEILVNALQAHRDKVGKLALSDQTR